MECAYRSVWTTERRSQVMPFIGWTITVQNKTRHTLVPNIVEICLSVLCLLYISLSMEVQSKIVLRVKSQRDYIISTTIVFSVAYIILHTWFQNAISFIPGNYLNQLNHNEDDNVSQTAVINSATKLLDGYYYKTHVTYFCVEPLYMYLSAKWSRPSLLCSDGGFGTKADWNMI